MDLEFNWLKNVNLLEIKSDKIKKSRITSFVKSSLLLNNIPYTKTDKIYLLFIKEKSLYQILIFNESFDVSYLECFKVLKIVDEERIVLFIHHKYLVVYKDKSLYYFQKINYELDSEDRIKEYLENRLNLSICKLVKVGNQDLYTFINDYKKSKVKSTIIDVNKQKNSFFKIYTLYIFIVAIVLFYIINYPQANKKIIKISKVIKYEKFISFNDKYSKFLRKTRKYKLKLELFSYDKKILKVSLSAKRKKDIYSFLLEYKNKVKNSSISYLKDKKHFYCETELFRL